MIRNLNECMVELKRQLDQPETLSLNGAVLIGHLPHIGAKAYLHALFPAQRDASSEMVQGTQASIPAEAREFYREVNGMILFQGALSIYGVRVGNSRDPDLRQPFDLADRNVLRRPSFAEDGDFFLGSYNEDGSLLFTERGSSKVFRRPAASRSILNAWPSVWDMVTDEVIRLGRLFDRRGLQIDPTAPTSPSS